EDAKMKVGKDILIVQEVMQAINGVDGFDNKKLASGRFTLAGGEHAFAQSMKMGKKLDKLEDTAKDYYSKPQSKEAGEGGAGWKDVEVKVRVECTYYVQPRPKPGAERSGKCVVDYKIKVIVSGTNTAGKASTATYGSVDGSVWFINDNLKTTDLVGD